MGLTTNLTEILPGDFYISAEAIIITSEEDVDKFIESRSLIEKLESYKYHHSSIYIVGIKEHVINIYKYKLLGGSNYNELPKEYACKKNGLVNIRNDDNMCFKWYRIAHKFPAVRDKNRVTKYIKHDKELNYTGITFSVTLNQISKIE